MSERDNQFLGKYRGVVIDNRDPTSQGRLKVMVPEVLGNLESSWAMPCVPYAGKDVGLFLLPPIRASVWVEFEHGNPDYPIWAGCFWREGETPAAVPEKKILQTDFGSITLDDIMGGESIKIETVAGMKIILYSSGIEITAGQSGSIKLISVL